MREEQCTHPKNRIWQWSDHWFCCKCWYRERGKYENKSEKTFEIQKIMLIFNEK
jgi:hypothetical protein